ncbi:hypothetical protein D3C71_1316720 [compost metagenome]
MSSALSKTSGGVPPCLRKSAISAASSSLFAKRSGSRREGAGLPEANNAPGNGLPRACWRIAMPHASNAPMLCPSSTYRPRSTGACSSHSRATSSLKSSATGSPIRLPRPGSSTGTTWTHAGSRRRQRKYIVALAPAHGRHSSETGSCIGLSSPRCRFAPAHVPAAPSTPAGSGDACPSRLCRCIR